MEEDTKGVN